jgi:hypothetical protein
MTALAHFFWLTFQWRFALMWIVVPGATLVPLAIVFFLSGPAFRWLRIALIALLVGSFVMMITMMVVGPTIVSKLIHLSGSAGEGVITDEQQTSEMYNSQYVSLLSAVLKTRTGQVVETSFKDSDFNVWPTDNVTRYPSIGQHFTTRYLPGYPDEFVIVSDDDSDYAKSLRCGNLNSALASARKRNTFAGSVPVFQRRLAEAERAAQAGGCMATPDFPASRDKADTALSPAAAKTTSPAPHCPALVQSRAAALRARNQALHDLSLRRSYFLAASAVKDAGCAQ